MLFHFLVGGLFALAARSYHRHESLLKSPAFWAFLIVDAIVFLPMVFFLTQLYPKGVFSIWGQWQWHGIWLNRDWLLLAPAGVMGFMTFGVLCRVVQARWVVVAFALSALLWFVQLWQTPSLETWILINHQVHPSLAHRLESYPLQILLANYVGMGLVALIWGLVWHRVYLADQAWANLKGLYGSNTKIKGKAAKAPTQELPVSG